MSISRILMQAGRRVPDLVAYVTSQAKDSIISIDISNPSNLVRLDSFTSVNLNAAQGVVLDLTNQVAYVVSSVSDSITSIDISNPFNLVELDSFTSASLDGATNLAVDVANQVAYVASFNADSVTAIDISDPNNLAELDSFTSASLDGADSIAVDVANQVAYVITTLGALSSAPDSITSIDISNPSSLAELDSLSSATLRNARGIALSISGPASTNAYE